MILVINFGGQYSQLITRLVRKCGVYCEIIPFSRLHLPLNSSIRGIILSGGPSSVYEPNAPDIDENIFALNIPILGICYGAQLIAKKFGGHISKSKAGEYGKTEIILEKHSKLFQNITEKTCFMSHSDQIEQLPSEFKITAKTANSPIAAAENTFRNFYLVQFHPEVEHTPCGEKIIQNFLHNICKLTNNWEMPSFKEQKTKEIRQMIGDNKAICAISGGVDSCVAAVLVHNVIGKKLTCILIDHGLMRKDEVKNICKTLEVLGLNIICINATKRFLARLSGIYDPEQKRKIIGEEFIRVFEEEAARIGDIKFLIQGTIYPDIVESGLSGASHIIKSHHNVGGLPADLKLSICEPLKELFKDEVRNLGKELNIPDEIISRQPFPGPGLAIRIIGKITPKKLKLVRETDVILSEEIIKSGLKNEIWQYFTCLLDTKSVGVTGDYRTYGFVVVVRAITSSNAMTCDWAKLPTELLNTISTRIVNEVPGINRVVYDITSKPPGTIEWE
ncbi:MAG: glutamine-hydrolyzing GMP synthase [Oscillospiraceae bacterium]|jgi:GMP synthase (glutamine-hydrolysing)|nr:glutamine-hydrolyzing GMP synthase [Oscillospiraceae bacterium]